MITRDAAPLRYKSKSIAWSNSGRGDATFDASFIPDQGPNGGVIVIDRIVVHADLNLTVATATTQGEDLYRAFRYVTVSQVDGEKRYDQVSGDSLRLVNYAMLGADATIEHTDFAAGTGDQKCTAVIPLSKPFAFEPDDYALPAYLLREVKIGMAQGSDMSLGSSVVTVNSGDYWIIAECHEEFGVVQHAVDTISELDFDTASSGTMPVNGRPHDLFLFVRGADGGASLANLTDVFIPTGNIYDQPYLLDPDLKQHYARLRGQATNGTSATGAARSTDPFVGSTTRACAALLAHGTKAWEMPEVKSLLVKTTLGGALSLRMIARATKRKTGALKKLIMETHGVNASYIKTSGKTRRNLGDWSPEQAAYMPEKFIRVSRGGKRESVRLFAGRRP